MYKKYNTGHSHKSVFQMSMHGLLCLLSLPLTNVTAHFRREVFEVKSDGVGFLDVSYSSMGVTVVTYVLISTGVVLDGDSLLASIQVNKI